MPDFPQQNADFSRRAVMDTADMDWQRSPSSSVWRKRLELSGPAEAGRVTSVVRYEAGSAFPSHPHPDGEEILVLSGVFSDERGDYPAGTFLLNPEGFRHAPSSRDGCLLFVKLRQYSGLNRRQIMIDTARSAWMPGRFPGVEQILLYREDGFPERTRLVRLAPGTEIPSHDHPGGEEAYVLAGTYEDDFGAYREGSWIRYPCGSGHFVRTEDGCTLYLKSGHLR